MDPHPQGIHAGVEAVEHRPQTRLEVGPFLPCGLLQPRELLHGRVALGFDLGELCRHGRVYLRPDASRLLTQGVDVSPCRGEMLTDVGFGLRASRGSRRIRFGRRDARLARFLRTTTEESETERQTNREGRPHHEVRPDGDPG